MLRKRYALAGLIAGMLSLLALGAAAQVDPNMDAVVAKALADPAFRESIIAESLEVIHSDASWGERYRAARILGGAGTEDCVAPLAALLADPDAAPLARYALQPLPYPSVDAAFREALANSTGVERLGLIASIRDRRDAGAVDTLAGLLGDADQEIVLAAVRALGQIATPEAVAQIAPLLDADDAALRYAAAEGCLAAAEQLAEAGQKDVAGKLYAKLLAPGWDEPVRAGAFSGMLRNDPDKAPDLVLGALRGDDALLSAIAIASLATLEGEGVTEQFAALLPQAPEALQAPLLEALAQRDDALPLPALHDMLNVENEAVRLVALRMLGDAGDVSTVAPLCDLLGRASSRDETQAILETLRRLQGDAVNGALIEAMKAAPEAQRSDLIAVLAQRQAYEAWPALIEQAQVEAVRPAAFRALAQLARPDDFDTLLGLLVGLQGDAGRSDAEEAIAALGRRIASERGGLVITSAQYGAAPDGPWADVTEKVAALVSEGSLTVAATNAQFGDPAPNVVKTLRVAYEAAGQAGQAEVGENQTLTLVADAPPTEATAKVKAALDQAADPRVAASMLRVLGRLATSEAFDAVVARLDDADAAVHDAAVRVLADWPTVQAVDVLAKIAGETEQTAHHALALRGCVRLLRSGEIPAVEALTVYDRLSQASRTVDDRRTLLAGLADVAHPAALWPVRAALEYLDDVDAEAQLALDRIQEAIGATEAFAPIFNGESLDGWSGAPGLWRAENGRIIGQTQADAPLEANTFLIWEGGEPGDFEVRFRYRLETEAVNSGLQIRSERFDDYRLRGYQADIASDDWITGICYEEGGRGVMARRGEIVTYGPDGSRNAKRFAEENELGEAIRAHDWNDYHVVAWGNQIVTRVNGRITHVVIDDAPEARRSGVIGFQLHVGPPMRVAFRDIELRQLPPAPTEE